MTMKKISLWGITAILTALFCGCSGSKTSTDEEYIAFIQEILTSAYQEEASPEPFNNAFDRNDFAQRIIALGDIPASSKKELVEFLESYFQPGDDLLRKVKEDGAEYQLLKFYRQNDTAHALFRLYNGGISMEDWTLVTRKNQIYVADICNVISGLNWSDEWNMNACLYLSIQSDHFFLFEKLIGINQLVGQEAYAQADSLYTWVEQACQTNLYAQVLRLNLVSQSQSFDSLGRYAEHFLQLFPAHEDIIHFYLLQNAIHNGAMPQVDSLCKRLEQDWGYDPIYFLYKAWGYKAAEQLPESMRMLDSLIAYMPLVYDFYNYKLDLYDEMDDDEGFVRQLEKTDELFSASEEDIPFYESTYPNRVKSAAYREWKQKHLVKLAAENQP